MRASSAKSALVRSCAAGRPAPNAMHLCADTPAKSQMTHTLSVHPAYIAAKVVTVHPRLIALHPPRHPRRLHQLPRSRILHQTRGVVGLLVMHRVGPGMILGRGIHTTGAPTTTTGGPAESPSVLHQRGVPCPPSTLRQLPRFGVFGFAPVHQNRCPDRSFLVHSSCHPGP